MQHEHFQVLLDALVQRSGIGQEVLGEVLARVSLRAPAETSRVEISRGNPTARRFADQRAIPQGTVSKAVKALKEVGLLEDGEKLLRSEDGRMLAPLRFGSLYAIAGVKVVLSSERPTQVTTALHGLNSSQVFGTAHGSATNWDQVAELIHRHVRSLKGTCDQDRTGHGLNQLLMFGVGVEVGAPAYNGEVMPLSGDGSKLTIKLAAMLHDRFEADPSFDEPVAVIVENDINALAVLAIHQLHYTDPDLVVIGGFNEGVGGGLVMDGRLRRGGNGRAMEIGHLAVSFPPGHDSEPQAPRRRGAKTAQSRPAATGFSARCSCGQFGHVDTLATPRRIEGELGDSSLEQIGEIDPLDPRFDRTKDVFSRGGAALGRALAHVSNTVNPSKVIMYLPAALAEPKPDTAAASYLAAVKAEATRAFAASDQPNYITVRALPSKPEEAALLGAKAAAVCVLESFIEHALRLDGCKPGKRTVTSSRSPAE